MYMNGSGIEPYFYTVTSENSITLPTGILCLINYSIGANPPFNGTVYALKGDSRVVGLKVTQPSYQTSTPGVYIRTA